MPRQSLPVALIFFASLSGPLSAQSPERERLSDETFRRGLKQLGLNDLLNFYVKKYPPSDPVEAALLQRELLLSLYADPRIPTEERLAASHEATEILRRLIGEHPQHAQRMEWRLKLGGDLIERTAEPYYNNILFQGGTPQDVAALAGITSEALQIYDRLIGELSEAVRRIDNLSIREFEEQARTGQIELLEGLLPKARYFSMWARYYHCLTLADNDPTRTRYLNEIIDYLNEESKLTSLDHSVTRYQAQSLLLAGMAYRLLGSFDRAESSLARSSSIASNLSSFTERHQLRWVVTLAELERIKNFRDSGQHEAAVAAVRNYRSKLPTGSAGTFGLELALALVEGTIYQVQADALTDRESARRQQLLLQARQPLIDLARSQPAFQDQVYDVLLKQMDTSRQTESLDPFEKSIYISGLLRQCGQVDQQVAQARKDHEDERIIQLMADKQKHLAQAIALAESLLSDTTPTARELAPEVRFNLAVCYHEQNQPIQAVRAFNTLVNEHPNFSKSATAADYAVRLAENLYQQARTPADRESLRPLLIEALRGLLNRHGELPEARNRIYFFAALLKEQGLYAEAIQQYQRISSDQPQFLSSLYDLAECNLLLLRSMRHADGDPQAVIHQFNRTIESAERYLQKQQEQIGGQDRRRQGQAILMLAEAYLLGAGPRPQEVLEKLKTFDSDFAGESDLLGACMRLRILAYQADGKLDQAAAIVPDYIQRDPAHAGATLQGLLTTFNEEINEARRKGQDELVATRAKDALFVAEALSRWADSEASGVGDEQRAAFRVDLGEALLRAGDYQQALNLFTDIVQQDGAAQPDGQSRNSRAVFGLAEAFFMIGQYEQALTHYSRVFQGSSENTERWWRAFLGEIRCRKKLEQDPEILYNLMSQKESLFPHLGGPEFKPQFEQLKRELRIKKTS